MRGIEEVGCSLAGCGARVEGLASRFRLLGCHKKLSAQASSRLGVRGGGWGSRDGLRVWVMDFGLGRSRR